jgi:Dolichyl-phosphate-mannose-protein mannosyltransferase
LDRAQGWWLALLLLTGSALRVVPFLLDRSLWLDEAKLALNVVERSPAQLFRPLDYEQAAPVGFLLLEKGMVAAFGEGERALRLVPLLCGLGALWAFFPLARRWLSPAESLLALALFALAQPLVYYSTEVKQYSTDVLVALGILWAAGRALDGRPRATWLLVPAGVLGPWLSHPAVFVAAGIILTLTLSAWLRGERRTAGLFAAVGAAWAASFLVHYALVLRGSDPTGFLVRFWAEGFPPLPPRSLAELLWPVRIFFGFFVDPAGLGLAGIAAAAFAMGCWRYGRRDARVLGLLVSPGLFTLLAALLRLYPFPTSGSLDAYPLPGRVVLFLVPSAVILVAAGLGDVARAADRDRQILAGAMAGFLLVSMAVDAVTRPAYGIRLNELRPLIAAVARDGRAGDTLALNARAMPVFRYYVRQYEAASGFVAGLAIVELPGTNRWNAYERQLRAIPDGTRVWVLYAHHPTWRSQQDEAFVLYELARRRRLAQETIAPGAALHRFDPS